MGLFTRRDRERERRDELLSAYLDGELGAGERERLEMRLATDPALRAELEALRHTVALVRNLPTVPIPRNFILPQRARVRPRPARQARPRRAWAAPFLAAATAVVSLMFVVVLAGDLLLFGAGKSAGGMASAPPSERMVRVEAPQEALVPPPAGENEYTEVEVGAKVEVEVEAEAGEEVLSLGAMPTNTPLSTSMEVPPEAAPTTTGEERGYAVETAEGAEVTAPAADYGGPTMEPAVPAPIPTPAMAEEAGEAPALPATATAASKVSIGGAEPTPTEEPAVATRTIGEEEPGAAEAEHIDPVVPPGELEFEGSELVTVSPWRVLEIVLGLAALGLALATIWAWRIRRRQG